MPPHAEPAILHSSFAVSLAFPLEFVSVTMSPPRGLPTNGVRCSNRTLGQHWHSAFPVPTQDRNVSRPICLGNDLRHDSRLAKTTMATMVNTTTILITFVLFIEICCFSSVALFTKRKDSHNSVNRCFRSITKVTEQFCHAGAESGNCISRPRWN